MEEPLHVMVGLVRDARGRVLIGRRRAGQHMAGAWEFPGGKRRRGETPSAALGRELAEELGIVVVDAEPLLGLVHEYPDRRVRLDVWTVLKYSGEPHAREGQALRWATIEELATVGLLEADQPIVETLSRASAGTGRRR